MSLALTFLGNGLLLICLAALGCSREGGSSQNDPQLTLRLGKVDKTNRSILAELIVSNPGPDTIMIPRLGGGKSNGINYRCYCIGIRRGDRYRYILDGDLRATPWTSEFEFTNLVAGECMRCVVNLANAKWHSALEKDRHVQHPFILDNGGTYGAEAAINVNIEDIPLRFRTHAWRGSAVSPMTNFSVHSDGLEKTEK